MTLDEKIYRCWRDGVGIRETMRALGRIGIRVAFEDVRLRFVALSERFG